MIKNEKIKVVPNCPKWRENLTKLIFGFFTPPPTQKKINDDEKYAVLAQMVDWSKAFDRQDPKIGIESFIKNGVRSTLIPVPGFLATPPQKTFLPKMKKSKLFQKDFFAKFKEKNQSCYKLPEMVRKLIEKAF